jgi:hypothetical protein
MHDRDQCRAVKRDGNRCTNQAKFGGFCGVHLPKERHTNNTLSQTGQGIKTATQIIAVIGGAIKLIEEIVKVWQILPFGTRPQMPCDYYYLANQLGPIYPKLPKFYHPFNAGSSSVDWHRARQVYDEAKALLMAAEAEGADIQVLLEQLANLDRETHELFDSMQEPLREMVYAKIGDEADDRGANE